MWYHYKCFFKMNKPTQISEIAGFGGLRWDDQEKIKKNFSGGASASLTNVNEEDSKLADYQVDYAKSNRSKCKVCENKICKEEIRIAIMVDGDAKQLNGKIPAWHHVECFAEKKKEEPELADIGEHHISGYSNSLVNRCSTLRSMFV